MILKLVLQLLFVPISASAQLSASMTCTTATCHLDQDTPLYSTGDPQMDEARWSAFRHELNQQYELALKQIEQSTQSWASEKAKTDQLKPEEAKKVFEAEIAKIKKSIPTLPSQMLTQEERRAINPYPQNGKAVVEKQLDRIWKEIKNKSPQKIAKQVALEMEALNSDDVEDDSLKNLLASQKAFLEKELTLSHITDYQGLLNFPHVQKLGVALTTPSSSVQGQELRALLNRNFANESTVRTSCLTQATQGCETALQNLENQTAALYAIDRIVSRRPDESGQQAATYFLKAMSTQIAFAEGFVEGGINTIEGIKALASVRPDDVQTAIQYAYTHFPEIAEKIGEVLEQNWQAFSDGTPDQRAKILGRASFEIATSFLGATKSPTWLTKSSALIKSAESSLEVLNQSVRLGVKITDKNKVQALKAIQKTILESNVSKTQAKALFNKLDETRLNNYVKAISETQDIISDNAVDYITKKTAFYDQLLPANQYKSSSEIVDDIKKYVNLEEKIMTIEGKEISETVLRGVSSNNSPNMELFFKVHPKSIMANGRYSVPGEGALYTTVVQKGDDLEGIKTVISLEIGEPVDQIVFSSIDLKLKNALDLKSSATLHDLKLDEKFLIDIDNYEYTQMIGHIAKKNGFDGVKVNSAIDLTKNPIENISNPVNLNQF